MKLDISTIAFGRIQRRIIKALAAKPEHWIDTRRLIHDAYWDAEDGGPLDAKGSIKQHIHQIRRRLWQYGYDIEGIPKVGRRLVRRS